MTQTMTHSLDLETLDALWKARHREADLRDLERLLEALARETTDLSARYELDWRRARLDQFQAMQLLAKGSEKVDKRAARAAFERGAEVSQWTLAEPSRGEGRFWHAVNNLEFARMGQKLGALWALRPARAQLKSVLAWDESFHFAGPHRVLGRIAHLAPSRSGGDFQSARAHFERALELCDNSTTRLYFAGLLEDLGDKTGAKAQIEAILAAPDDENWMWEQNRDREKAAEWLAQANSRPIH